MSDPPAAEHSDFDHSQCRSASLLAGAGHFNGAYQCEYMDAMPVDRGARPWMRAFSYLPRYSKDLHSKRRAYFSLQSQSVVSADCYANK